MAFYFALLNVSKKDTSQEKPSSHKKHRRHSIASVESPLLNYRLLPRPQLLSDDVVITNDLAHQVESSSTAPPSQRLADRRSRGSARASKWVEDNHNQGAHVPVPHRHPLSSRHVKPRPPPVTDPPPPLSRSKRMAFPSEEPKNPKRGGVSKSQSMIPVPKRDLLGTKCPPMVPSTDESGRSSSQMSNDSTPLRRDDSPASSLDAKEGITMKLSGMSMSSRCSEPRLKKVTFESSPYVISNSFLGDGAGKVLVVRRGSGTAVRRVPRPPEVVNSGDDWWRRCGGGEEEAINDNQLNRNLESGTRSILRRGLIRRRSTSDKTRLLAYRNSGFLSSSQERKSESTSTSRMTVSVDRPKYPCSASDIMRRQRAPRKAKVGGEYCVNEIFRVNRRPKYAIINMDDNKNISALEMVKKLNVQGIHGIQFFDDLSLHPTVISARVPDPVAPVIKEEPRTPVEVAPRIKEEPWSPELDEHYPYAHGPKNGSPACQNRANGHHNSPIANPNPNPKINGIKPIAHIKKELSDSPTRLESVVAQIKAGLQTTKTKSVKSEDCLRQQLIDGIYRLAELNSQITSPLTMFNTSAKAATQISASLPTPYSLNELSPLALMSSLSKAPSMGQRPKRTHEPRLEEEFLKCSGCPERVQITNYGHMVAHTKKHLNVRSYTCTECTFSSDVWNTITGHMRGQHEIQDPAPIRQHFEESAGFKKLLNELFPGKDAQMEKVKIAQMKRNSEIASEGIQKEGRKRKMATPVRVVQEEENPTYRCIGCDIDRRIETPRGAEADPNGLLANHIRLHHHKEILQYQCEECGYGNTKEWIIRCHIFYRHMKNASVLQPVVTKNVDWNLILTKFYPELAGKYVIPVDLEEEEVTMLANNKTITNDMISKNRAEHK